MQIMYIFKLILRVMSTNKDTKDNLVRILKWVAYIATAIVSFLTGASI